MLHAKHTRKKDDHITNQCAWSTTGMCHFVTDWLVSSAWFLSCALERIFPLNSMMHVINRGNKANEGVYYTDVENQARN